MGAALGLGLTVARRPWPLITGATLVLGLAVATNSVSRPLFTWPFAATTRPSSSTTFRTSTTCICLRLPTGSCFNSAKWLSI